MNMLRKLCRKFGYDLVPTRVADENSFVRRIPYATETEKRIMATCRPYSQTTPETMFALLRAVQYLAANHLDGCFVECGVWKGGSALAMAMMLDALRREKDIYLFDTFSGMPAGCAEDVDLDGNDERWYREKSDAYIHAGIGAGWNAVSVADVKNNVAAIGDTRQKFHFVQGPVEDTLPSQAPNTVALLRLDTDFYASTKQELTYLFPRLSKGGILIVDDYGHFLGARKAVDEYFQANEIRMFMHRIDYTAIIGIKP